MTSPPSQLRLLLASTLICAGVWLIARWLAMQLVQTAGFSGVAAFAVAWTALYPLAWRNRSVPAWMHWARGGAVLLVLWIFSILSH
jgi:hypothetical protein